MTDKYAREMILAPKDWMKPPAPFLPDSSLQEGRGEPPDPNEAYWKRQYMTDQWVLCILRHNFFLLGQHIA